MENKQLQTNKKNGNKERPVYIGCIVLLVCIIIMLLLRCCGKPTQIGGRDHPDRPSSGTLTVESMPEVEPQHFKLNVNCTPTLIDGRLNLRVQNTSANASACRVDVVLQRYTGLSGAEDNGGSQDTFYLKGGDGDVNGDANVNIVALNRDTHTYRLRALKEGESLEDYQQITLEDASEVIYESPLILPGQSLEHCTIEKELEPGRYYGVACFTIVDPETEAVQGMCNVLLEITIR